MVRCRYKLSVLTTNLGSSISPEGELCLLKRHHIKQNQPMVNINDSHNPIIQLTPFCFLEHINICTNLM